MHPFRDTQDESILDRIDSNRRQLFIRLGRDIDQNTKEQIQKQITSKANLSKQLRPYERYNRLKINQKQVRLYLESTERLLEELKKKRGAIQQQSKGLNELKQIYLGMMSDIKRSQQLDHKIQALSKQTQVLNQIFPKLQPQIDNLKSVNFTNNKILKQKEDKEQELQKLERKLQFLKKQLEAQRKLYQKFSLERVQYQDQLNQLQGKRIAKQMTEKTIKQILLKPQILGTSSIVSKQSQEPSYTRLNRSVEYNTIVKKQKVPTCYWLWVILLILWAIMLFLVIPKVKQNIYDHQCI